MKRFLISMLTLCLALSPTLVAVAAENQVTGVYTNSLEVRFQGDTFNMYDSDGFRVYPIIKEGSTYLPIRALSEKFGKTIEWDAENFAVKIYDDAPSLDPQQTQPGHDLNYPIVVNAVESKKLVIYYQNEIITFYDVNGSIVYPIIYNGTTYLPVRALSDLWGTPIVWDADRYAVYIGNTVKDASSIDDFNVSPSQMEEDVTFFGVTWPTALCAARGCPLSLDIPEGKTRCRIKGIDAEGKARVCIVRPQGDDIIYQAEKLATSDFDLEIPLSGATQIIVEAMSTDGTVYIVEVEWL